jgi:hypothetical protein
MVRMKVSQNILPCQHRADVAAKPGTDPDKGIFTASSCHRSLSVGVEIFDRIPPTELGESEAKRLKLGRLTRCPLCLAAKIARTFRTKADKAFGAPLS